MSEQGTGGQSARLSDSSHSIQVAISQLEYASRLLQGDAGQNAGGLDGLHGGLLPSSESSALDKAVNLSSALSSCLSSLRDPSMLAVQAYELQQALSASSANPPLPSSMSSDVTALLARGHAAAMFQPRQLLALAGEVRSLFTSGGDQAHDGRAHEAVQLARQTIVDVKGKSLLTEVETRQQRSQGLLNARKRKAAASIQAVAAPPVTAQQEQSSPMNGPRTDVDRGVPTGVDSPLKKDDAIVLGERFEFPGQDRASTIAEGAPAIEPTATTEDRRTIFQAILQQWKHDLGMADAEAAASTQYSVQSLDKSTIRLKLALDQVGVAFIWIRTARMCFVERINLLAESEIDEGECDGSTSSSNDVSELRRVKPSSFPLYRQIASQFHAKILAAVDKIDKDARDSDSSSMVVIVNTLFAIASLCHLHDPFPTLSLRSHNPPRGTAAVLSALSSWSPEARLS